MTIPHKYIYIALGVVILSLVGYLAFKEYNSPYEQIQRQNDELLKEVDKIERLVHDLGVERKLRTDTIREIETRLKINEKSYYNEIAYILSADYRTTDSVYWVNSRRFDSAFYAGQFNPR